MSIHPNPSFPLLASDQADVIRIFLELLSERERAARASEVAASQPLGPRNDSNDLWLPRQPPDLD
jgi:hypothetical protein